MFDLDTSIHIVGHEARSSLCRIPSSLVAFHICYLLDRASVHEISTLVTWFQCMLDIFNFYGDIDPLYIFGFHGDHDPLYIFIMEILIYLYCTWWWPQMSYFVSCLFHGHCSLMYLGLLYVFAVICRDICTILLDGWFFHLVLHHSTSLHF